MTFDPNFYNLQGYEAAINGYGKVVPAGTDAACVAAYEKGYQEGIEELAYDPRGESYPGEYDDDLADYDGDPDGKFDLVWDDGQYDDDPNPYSGT